MPADAPTAGRVQSGGLAYHGPMPPFRAGFWIVAPVIGTLAGLLSGLIFDVELLVSGIRGAFIGAPALLYERGLLFQAWRDLIRRAATPIFVAATLATYIAMIAAGNAGAGTVLHHALGYMPNPRVSILISGDLLDRLSTLPSGIIVEDLGSRSVRGRHEPLRIAAVHKGFGLSSTSQASATHGAETG